MKIIPLISAVSVADVFGSVFLSAADGVAGTVFGNMMTWLYETIFDGLSDFFSKITNMGAEIFELSWVEAFIQLFYLFGWALFAVGIIVSAFDLALEYQNGRANIRTTALNWIKGFLAAGMFTTVPVELYKFCVSLQNTFSKDLVSVFAADKGADSIGNAAIASLATLAGLGGVVELVLIIALGYCVIKIFFDNIKRGGILLIQLAVGSLYMFSIPRGYSDGFNHWCRQVIGLCLTAFLQTTLLMLGLMTFIDNPLLGIGIMLAAKEVPRIADRFGLETGARPNVGAAVHTATSAVNLVKTVLH
ncbi:MAG: DUF6045 family protein [Clostridiales bacterium]|nr:DUF6045 family protein [Clostridiales bacterium]